MTTGERIKYLRMKSGMTQAELAQKAGIGQNTVGSIERGINDPELYTVRSIAKALGVHALDLLQDSDAWFFTQLDFGASMPKRAHETDAGFDLYAVKADMVPARGSVIIDTGVHVAIPRGYAGLIVSKSGLNVNYGLTSDGLIDSGYTGSIKVKLYNNSDDNYLITAGDKVSQIVFIPIAEPTLVQVDSLPNTERGDGGFGSTGK